MKKLIMIAALTVAAAPAAMASKARMTALADSRQILDFQTAFDRPYQFMQLGNMATIEWGDKGGTVATTSPHAEGGFLMKSDDMAYGAYLGRRASAFNNAVGAAVNAGMNANTLLEQNPINLYYASKMNDWTWGVTLKYSNGKDDNNDATATSSGLALAATNGTWEAELIQGITGKSEFGADSVESKGMTEVTVGYNIDEKMHAYASYGMVKADAEIGGTSSTVLDATSMEVGFINTVVKDEDANFFYGVAYSSSKVDGGDETMALPVWMGIEANATSWMVMRASVKQNVIINEVKEDDGDKKDLDSITFAAGLGMKLGKGMLDATFGTDNGGHLSFSNGSVAAQEFLTTVAYTYNF